MMAMVICVDQSTEINSSQTTPLSPQQLPLVLIHLHPAPLYFLHTISAKQICHAFCRWAAATAYPAITLTLQSGVLLYMLKILDSG